MSRPAELFVVSDLHIGGAAEVGRRGFRMHSDIGPLAGFLREVSRRRKAHGHAVQLVINGDFVDFLAEQDPVDQRHHAFIGDGERAAAVFDQVVKRDPAVFDELRELVAAGVALTLVLGNHDLELSLPAVRARLERTLGLPAPGGFRFVYDGEAHVVGDVLIEHGNRYDGWNVVDHDRLRRHRSEASRRLAPSRDGRFTAPAGSMLVERVMNPIKRDYPFIDLLKPETDAALPLLLALEPSLAGALSAVQALQLAQNARRHGVAAPARPALSGDIAAGPDAAGTMAPLRDLLRTRPDGEMLMQLADAAQAAQGQIAACGIQRALSFVGLRASPAYETRLRVLLGALRALGDDRSFDRGVEADPAYLDAAEALGQGGFAVVVFGHTHLAKQVALKTCPGIYINTGTWADLLRVPDSIVSGAPAAAQAALADFARALRTQDFSAYIEHRPTYAHVLFDDAGRTCSAALRDFVPGCVESAP